MTDKVLLLQLKYIDRLAIFLNQKTEQNKKIALPGF